MSNFVGFINLSEKLFSLNNNQSFSFKHNDNTYTIVYSGKLYNSKDIKKQLTNQSFEFNRFM